MKDLSGQIKYVIPTEKGNVETVMLTPDIYAKVVELINGNQSVVANEKDWLVNNAIDGKFIADRYNKSNNNKNNYSTKEIARMFDVSDEGKEIEIANRVFEKIKGLR